MKKFKTKNKFKWIKLIIFILIIYLSFSITLSLLLSKNITYEKYIKYLLNEGFNNQIKFVNNDILNIKPMSLIENNLNIKLNNSINQIEYIELKNKNMDKPIIYIYNTHDSETYKSNYLNDYNIIPSVTLASNILQEYLEDLGINSIVETRKPSSILKEKNLAYNNSYIVSRELMQDAANNYNSLKYFIDIHRDSSSYTKTTLEYDNKLYAKVEFIVGLEHDNYMDNLNMSEQLNKIIELKVNGISRGIYKKEGPGVNGIYNQDFNKNTILIEAGGKDNSIEEVTNTMKVLSEAIFDYIKGETNEKEEL